MAVRIALVHDYLMDRGGAERVLSVLHRMFPSAPIYTSVHDRQATLPDFDNALIITSPLQRLRLTPQNYKLLLPLYPLVFRAFDLSGYDLVVSSASAYAKGVRHPASQHLCYCYTPTRFVWMFDQYVEMERLSPARSLSLRAMLPYLAWQDRVASRQVDHYAATCRNVAERIRRFYQREAEVIWPPISINSFEVSQEPGEFFLIISRLNRYKRIDTAIEACNRMKQPLVMAGSGPDAARLAGLAGPTVKLLGRVSEQEKIDLLRRCKALILPGEEDFGMTPLEANACGRPVVALARGGALETVLHGETGLLYQEPAPEAIIAAIDQLSRTGLEPDRLRRHATQFDESVFTGKIRGWIKAKTGLSV